MTQTDNLFDANSGHSQETRRSLAEAIRICTRLRESGHVAYFAGGCVRDALLGREPKDFDVATDATPERVRELFGKRKTLAFGASFGVIGVLPPNDSNNDELSIQPTEVATFRSDGEYSDGRRPDKVHYGDAENDAQRRDFTINGLFFDPHQNKVIDFVGGHEDLDAKRLRTIGLAQERFEEDKLRMLRAARFATTLGFALDLDTKAEIIQRADEIAVVSAERIGAEMRKIVTSENASAGLALLSQCGLDRWILPSLQHADAAKLEKYLAQRHERTLDSTMAIVLLLIAESPAAPSIDELIDGVSLNWRLSNEETRKIRAAVKHWSLVATAHERKWSEVQPTLVDRDIRSVVEVASTITKAEAMDSAGVQLCREALGQSQELLDPPPLITGETLREAGYRPGPQFRVWLQTVRDAQLDGQIKTVEQAFELIREMST